MSALAMKLDQCLLNLPPAQSAELEKQVQALLNSQKTNKETSDANGYPEGFWDEIRRLWGDEPFERPDQGVEEVREDW